jgi:hypothetical protein
LHCSCGSLHAASQHTPSTQNVDAHSAPTLQAAPFDFGVGVTVGVAVTVAVGVQQVGCAAPPHGRHSSF